MPEMPEFSALAEILERNRKYNADQEERVKQEPLGDWQSPSDNARWDALHMRLSTEALSYNIRKCIDKRGERDFLIAQKIKILTKITKESPPQEKPVSQILYSFFCTGPTKHDIRVNEVNRRKSNMMCLVRSIDEQLAVYDKIIDSIKIRVSRRMSLG
jgi:sulfur relay (sulfurtransferase) DsrC/TusE family protein